MRMVRRVLLWLVGIVLALVLFLIGSVLVDALVGGGRVAALTNTTIAGPGNLSIRAYVARPAGNGPHPVVIMVHEWWGLRPDLIGKADALASEGYVVVAPDLFRGSSTGWIPRAIYQVSTMPPAQVDSDLAAVYSWVAAQPQVQTDRIAVMGFCYGGGTALRYSLSNPNLAATAVFYGTPITDPQRLRALPGPVLGIFGGADTMIPVSEVRAMETALNQAGVENQISIYDGQPHAFVTDIAAIRAGGPQGKAWAELLGFLGRTLKEQAGSGRVLASVAAPSIADPSDDAILGPERLLHIFVCDRAING